MKKSIIFSVMMIIGASVLAQDKFTEAMKTNIAQLYNAKDEAELQAAVNSLERISAAEKSRWEAFYYLGFGYIQLAVRDKENGKQDEYLDQADAAITKARDLKKENSEITALDGFSLMMRISVDPGTRGQQYSGLAMQKLGTAVALDNTNPRALLLQAQMQFGMAQFFGQAPTEACAGAARVPGGTNVNPSRATASRTAAAVGACSRAAQGKPRRATAAGRP